MPSLRSWSLGVVAEAKSRILDQPRVRQAVHEVRNRRLFSELSPHEQMLADDVRVDTYHEALTKLVQDGDVVLDIGAGTGILSFYAAKAGARRVYGLDHSPFVARARAMVAGSGASNVTLVNCHSREFKPPEQIDKIVHEQMGYQLFEEKMVPNLLDARDRLLKPGGRILPNRFELYLEALQLDDEYRLPFVWERTLHGMDLSALRELAGQQPRSYYLMRLQAAHFSHFLCDPEPVLEIDLETMSAGSLPTRLAYERDVVRSGRIDGFGLWFRARFDDEIALTTSPAARNTHWGFTLLRVESKHLEAGEKLSLELRGDLEDPLTWAWSHRVS